MCVCERERERVRERERERNDKRESENMCEVRYIRMRVRMWEETFM